MSDSEFGYTCPKQRDKGFIESQIPEFERNHNNYGKSYQIRVFETDDFLLRFTYSDSVWAMCVKDMFTIDFDIKEGVTRDHAIDMIHKYTDVMYSRGISLLFSLYETDRGLHAYLISERLSYSDERALKTSLDLCNDENYIIFTTMNGFCMRVGPKLRKQMKDSNKKEWMEPEEIDAEFIARPCYRDDNGKITCTIGYGRSDPYLVTMLNIYEQLIEFIKTGYVYHFHELMQRHSFTWNDIEYKNIHAPSLEFFEEVKNFADNLLSEHGVISRGEYQIPVKWTGFMNQYKPFLSKNTLYQCASVAPRDIERKALNTAVTAWVENCLKQAISIGGRDNNNFVDTKIPAKLFGRTTGLSYPFVFGVDKSSHMIFIQFRDLLMMDWDVKDGFEKVVPAQLLNRYMSTMKTLPTEERITERSLAFKMYETDNGVHAFCVSHKLPYDLKREGSRLSTAMEIMRNVCVDVWYIAFVMNRGFSIRIGPKIVNKKRGKGETDEMKPQDEVDSQFVQKLGVELPGQKQRLVYLGDGRISPYLNAVTDFIFNVQQYVKTIKNLAQRTLENPEKLSIEMGDVVKAMYDRDVRHLENPQNNSAVADYFDETCAWADEIWRCREV
jgi:hypothetical protein